MPRTYTASFSNVTVAAAQDLIQIKGASGKIVRVKRLWLGLTPTTLATAQSLQLRVRYLPATVTDGSGGSTPTFLKCDPTDAAASVTALCNNTTPASTNGTAVIMWTMGWHIYAPIEIDFQQMGHVPIVAASTSLVFELLSTVSGTVAMSGGGLVEELG